MEFVCKVISTLETGCNIWYDTVTGQASQKPQTTNKQPPDDIVGTAGLEQNALPTPTTKLVGPNANDFMARISRLQDKPRVAKTENPVRYPELDSERLNSEAVFSSYSG